MRVASCPLCAGADAATSLVAESSLYRVVRVLDAPDFPAFYRVIWNDHVAELSDLDDEQREACMEAVVAVERVLRQLSPAKINLAALGNMVPHLHWHVIARFHWDSHFPQPIWGVRQREVVPAAVARLAIDPETLDASVRSAVAALAR